MLSSISPVGEAGRRQRWGVTVGAYLVASIAGGAATGAAFGLVGALAVDRLSTDARLIVLVALAAAGLVADHIHKVPSIPRQVDERWLGRYRGWVYGAGFGAQLGTGIATIVPASIVWLTWAAAALTGRVAQGALVGLAFGTLRALPLVAAGRVTTVQRLRAVLARVEAGRRPAAQATLLGQAAVAIVAIALTVM